MNKTSIGIDIGLNSVKIVELTKDENGTVRVTKAATRYANFDWDVFQEQRTQILADFIKRIREAHKISSGKSVVVSLPCISVFVRYVDILETKRKKEDELIAYEAQQQIPLPIDEVAWDYNILKEDEQGGKKAILVAVKKDIVDETVHIVKKGGFAAHTVSLNLYCLLNVVKRIKKINNGEGVIIVDIGSESTGLIISRGRHVWLRRVTFAGKKITESIAQNANVDFAQAEEIKKKGPEAMASLDEETQTTVKQTIAYDLENLANEIERSIDFYKAEQMKIDSSLNNESFKNLQVVFTGGGAKLTGLLPFFKKRLDIGVSSLDSFEEVVFDKNAIRKSQLEGINTEGADIADEVKPLLSVAIGAALYGFEHTTCEINFLKKDIAVHKKHNVKKYLYALSYLFFFAAFIINMIFQQSEINLYKERFRHIKSMSEQMSTFAPQLARVRSDIAVVQSKSSFLMNYLQKRFVWLEVMDAIAHVLPPQVWLTNFQGSGFFDAGTKNELMLNGITLSYDQLNDFIIALRDIDLITEAKAESVVNKDEEFTFMLRLQIKNGTRTP
ncbi:MAG: type IV pilus assembly protein PilM [Candidatus Omnitrophica bacterium]|nr:type IV pilus assembly protein PilM [Candidatus Omnitrophota bacterium]